MLVGCMGMSASSNTTGIVDRWPLEGTFACSRELILAPIGCIEATPAVVGGT